MVIDTNVSIGEILDLPYKNIFSVMTPIFLSKTPPEWQKNLLHWKLDRDLSISGACHEIEIQRYQMYIDVRPKLAVYTCRKIRTNCWQITDSRPRQSRNTVSLFNKPQVITGKYNKELSIKEKI